MVMCCPTENGADKVRTVTECSLEAEEHFFLPKNDLHCAQRAVTPLDFEPKVPCAWTQDPRSIGDAAGAAFAVVSELR